MVEDHGSSLLLLSPVEGRPWDWILVPDDAMLVDTDESRFDPWSMRRRRTMTIRGAVVVALVPKWYVSSLYPSVNDRCSCATVLVAAWHLVSGIPRS